MPSFVRSSIGKKVIMAVTGVLLIGFIMAHMAGNLLVFVGPDAINDYAKLLKESGLILWVARIGLILIFVLHIASAIALKRENRKARPQAYAYKNTVQASIASRYMGLTGSVILLFVIGHLLHFTWTFFNPEYAALIDNQGRHDVYRMIVTGFCPGT